MKDFKGYVYPPARATKVAVEEFERRNQNKDALDWGIPAMDSRIVPAVPGDLITFIGRPGHGKTTLLIHLAKRFSTLTKGDKDVIVYATWETMVEEFIGILSSSESGYSLEDIARGRADIDRIKKSLVTILGNGIVVFGQSMETRDNYEPPSLVELDLALSSLREDGYNVRAVLVDYLQAIPGVRENFSGRESSKIISVSENVVYCKTIGKKHGAPVFLGVQARRDVDDYKGGLKFPAMHDAQWSSTIEQASDKVFGITMPSKYHDTVDLSVVGYLYSICETSFAVKMLKQRFGPVNSSDVWMLLLNPVTLSAEEHPNVGVDPGDDDGDIL